MENIAAASTHEIIFVIMVFMGYAIAFLYLLITLTKKEIKYLRKDNERSLEYFQERVERDLKRLQSENTELRKELYKRNEIN